MLGSQMLRWSICLSLSPREGETDKNQRDPETYPHQPISVPSIHRPRLHRDDGLGQDAPHKDILSFVIFHPINNSAIRVDEARDAGVGTANHVDAIFHRPKYARDDVVLRAHTPAEPSFVGDINKELRTTFYEFSGQVRKDGLPADRRAETESGTLKNSELLPRHGRKNFWHVNPGPGDGFSVWQIFSKWQKMNFVVLLILGPGLRPDQKSGVSELNLSPLTFLEFDMATASQQKRYPSLFDNAFHLRIKPAISIY